MEEGKGERYLASGRQYGNALLGVRHQEEDEWTRVWVYDHGAVSGPTVWNSLPAAFRLDTSLSVFHTRLKTFLMT